MDLGPVAAMAALAILGFQFALFASGGGLLIAAVAAFWFGAGVAVLLDLRRQGQNALIVAATIAVYMSAY